MSILVAQNLSQTFGHFDVFSGIHIRIEENSRIGLVGPNGIGKTTLLAILADVDSPATGTIQKAEDLRIGYLRQEAVLAFAEKDKAVYEEMLTVFRHIQDQEAKLREMERQMAEGDDSEELFTEYGHLQEAFELAEGYTYEVRIQQILTGLGFTEDSWQMPLTHLSGGQKTRALLARLLLEEPDLLILDEPTNHLDIETIRWLEGALGGWHGALLIVSHDRYFLDKVVNTIWEMAPTHIEPYRGNYSAYVRQRTERHERMETEWNTLMEHFYKELAYIEKHIPSGDGMAFGKLKRTSREVEAVRVGGLDAWYQMKKSGWATVTQDYELKRFAQNVRELRYEIKSLKNPLPRIPKLNLRLNTKNRSGNIVFRAQDLEIGYPNHEPLFTAKKLHVKRLDCVALIGQNGTGKTTFLKILMGEREPLSGEIDFGASLKIGYFAQAHDQLNPDRRVIDELLEHKDMPISEARNYLAQYLFRGDDVYKQIHELSGGERGRLALAILALEKANFILMDEPTNHLDIPSQEILQEVLEQFDGTLLLVSHDRYLIDRLATQIWELQTGKLITFQGIYQEYVAKMEQNKQTKTQEKSEKQSWKNERQRKIERETRKQEKRQAQIEEQITEVEEIIHLLEIELAKASESHDLDRVYALGEDYDQAKVQLEQLMEEWEGLMA